MLIGALHWLAWRRHNRYRRDAERELDHLAELAGKAPELASREIAVLVKRTALAAYPREHVASLTGDAWVRFLNDTSRGDKVVASGSAAFKTAAYRDGTNAPALVESARRWIRVHRA